MKNELLFTCCFCGQKFSEKEAHNAAPVIKNGQCCSACNLKYVLPIRLNLSMTINEALGE